MVILLGFMTDFVPPNSQSRHSKVDVSFVSSSWPSNQLHHWSSKRGQRDGLQWPFLCSFKAVFFPQVLCFFNGVFNLFYALVFWIWEQGVGNKQKQRFLIEQYFETLLLVLNLLWFYDSPLLFLPHLWVWYLSWEVQYKGKDDLTGRQSRAIGNFGAFGGGETSQPANGLTGWSVSR